MRTVQLTQHFTQQFLEIVIVGDAWKEATVCVTIHFPINTMNVFHIEFVLHLLPSVVEDVLAFLCRFIIEDRFEIHSLAVTVLYSYLLDTTATTHVEVFTLLVRYHHAVADVLHHQLGAVFFQILAPKVGTFFEGSLIV